jgi:hypothetical protein
MKTVKRVSLYIGSLSNLGHGKIKGVLLKQGSIKRKLNHFYLGLEIAL